MIDYRPATIADAESIARLHTRSWQENYRGAFSDSFLDHELLPLRLRNWNDRLAQPAPNQFVMAAVDSGNLLGFVCVYGAEDPEWGSLVDNLHVVREAKGRRIGATLMKHAGAWLASTYPDVPVYLFVLEQNSPARQFYERLGGVNVGLVNEEILGFPVWSYRYVWANPRVLDSA